MTKILIQVTILTLTVIILGCESFIVKIPDLKCIRCNEDGTKPGECATVKEPTFCDPQDSYNRNYMGCGTVIAEGPDGKHIVTKSCIADCNLKGVSVDDGECVRMYGPRAEYVQLFWRDKFKVGKSYLRTNYETISHYCYCESQACNVKQIMDEPSNLDSFAGGGVIKLSYILFLVPVVLAFALVPGLHKFFLN